MTPSRVSSLLLLAPLLVLLLGPSACVAQSRWKTGGDAPNNPCIYLYECIQADGSYAAVYGGQAGDCASRLADHTTDFGKFDRLTRAIGLLPSGSVLDVLPVENNGDMFKHEACILKKCLAGAEARTAAVKAREEERLRIETANARVAPILRQVVPAALAFDTANTMRLSYFLKPDDVSLNAAERWLVATKVSPGADPSDNRAVCNRKMGGAMATPAWVPAADPVFTPLATTSDAAVKEPVMIGLRSAAFHSMMQQMEQLLDQNAQLKAQLRAIREAPDEKDHGRFLQLRARARTSAAKRAEALQPTAV